MSTAILQWTGTWPGIEIQMEKGLEERVQSGIALGIAAQAERRSSAKEAHAARSGTGTSDAREVDAAEPAVSLSFYRRHTEKILRRYLHASMQVGRAPSILSDPVGRGWASSRPIRTFEDAVIFVLDVERCLARIEPLDRHILSRIVLQEYTQAEAAVMLGMSARAVSYKLPQALDRLTEHLLASGLLVLPD